jgi:IS6 family transposase
MRKPKFKSAVGEFKWKHYQAEIILWGVRWYLSYPISYRNLQEMMTERGLNISHTTPYRWVQEYAPKLNKKIRPYLKQTNVSYRADETYVKIKGIWHYLYRAVDSKGNTLDWMLSPKRDRKAAKKFFKKVLKNQHCPTPKSITTDKNAAYPLAVAELQKEQRLPNLCKHRQVKYLNNIQEQDHRFIKRLVKNNQWFQTFQTAENTLAGYESMHMIRKWQIRYLPKGNPLAQKQFIEKLFGIAA